MKKTLFLALMATGIMALAGCQSADKQPSVTYIDRAYTGTLPCADCSGIEATLLVNQDGTYVEQLVYLGTRDGNQTFYETGSWAKEGDKLRMTNANGERSYFLPSADDKSMVLLDQEGNKIQSQLNYTLNQVTASKKVGEYRYLADAATFTECKTGRTYTASGLDLEKGYSATGVTGGTPVYAEIEGYYTVRPSMEDGQFDPALVQTGHIMFDKSSSCK
ncbi:envelope stress response activation lipoprotein NlpE [Providencia vermicola]|uniref:Envelope stress response activation lipoprotein NlpE n=5 Tax=Providencia TaxID=586 RepID=A0AAI9MV21_PROST|nr:MULTISPECIES: envelope stress response activation lipoprotein NlpE [Providencia]ELR5044196.1 envelope stress response activation lipoprotein NlpE [Providencia rettgeri]ELR5034406.1 envelope stress response activation lipoprotein NlpE [Providencia stuartii]ELR5142514.1 envelope stress response activation lipoprotein NlpE [Providencia stuartii]ELR5291234.1 envelope stress response activation lipoprotein NlpE [Providencia stuartii]ELX8380880.1 envelope stress response activation lipoprotein Nl